MKPGWKTTEFWLSVIAMVVGLLMTSGFFAVDSIWGKILGLAGTVLASLGYSLSRGLAKSSGPNPPA